MTNSTEDKLKLTENMERLKHGINKAAIKKETLLAQVHEGSNTISNLTTTIVNSFNVLAAILNNNKGLPVVGFAFQMVALIPQSISMMTNPKATLAEKAFAGTFLAVITALSIAAFVVGAFAAAIIGTVISSILTIVNLKGLAEAIIQNNATSNEYDKNKLFSELINNRTIPEGNEFDELLSIRATQLERKLANKDLIDDVKATLTDELEYIRSLKRVSKTESSMLLSELYSKRDEKMTELADTLSPLENSKSIDQNIDKIQSLQAEILLLDGQIKKITPTFEQLAFEKIVAKEHLAGSVVNVSMAFLGVVLSAIGLLLMGGTIAAPPFIIPAVVGGVGVFTSIFTLVKWAADKNAERENTKQMDLRSAKDNESILDEALYKCGKQLNITASIASVSANVNEQSEPKIIQDLSLNKLTEKVTTSSFKPATEEKSNKDFDQTQFKKELFDFKKNSDKTQEQDSDELSNQGPTRF